MGEPDWDEVMRETSLDLGQLLPSKKDLLHLVSRMRAHAPGDGAEGRKAADLESVWQEMQAKCEESRSHKGGANGANGAHGEGNGALDLTRVSSACMSRGASANGDAEQFSTEEEEAWAEESAEKAGGARMADALDERRQRSAAKQKRLQENRQELEKIVQSADLLLKIYQVQGCVARCAR